MLQVKKPSCRSYSRVCRHKAKSLRVGPLSKIEEGKLMKLVHIEVHDEDEGEEWDERDKANYERNKQVQEDIDGMMTEGKVRLLLLELMLQLRSTLGPWTFIRSHVNDFSESGDARS